jgi:hypothetical protein
MNGAAAAVGAVFDDKSFEARRHDANAETRQILVEGDVRLFGRRERVDASLRNLDASHVLSPPVSPPELKTRVVSGMSVKRRLLL